MSGDPFDPPACFACGRWACRVVLEDLFDLEYFGDENIPTTGPYLLAANHVSFLDPPAVVIGAHRNCYTFARRSLSSRGLWNWLFWRFLTIPVNADGADIRSVRTALRHLAGGQAVVIFPEGTRSPDGHPLEAKAGAGLLAALAQVPVVPARIFGAFEAWGKNRSGPQFFAPVKVVYGRPILPDSYDRERGDRDRYLKISRRVMAAIAALELPSGVIFGPSAGDGRA